MSPRVVQLIPFPQLIPSPDLRAVQRCAGEEAADTAVSISSRFFLPDMFLLTPLMTPQIAYTAPRINLRSSPPISPPLPLPAVHSDLVVSPDFIQRNQEYSVRQTQFQAVDYNSQTFDCAFVSVPQSR